MLKNLLLVLCIMVTSAVAVKAEADEVETQIVLVTGVGNSVETAAQNAAENALTQVVGSFIDVDEQLQKKTIIENGVKQRSKEIDIQIREYSQGSIKRFEVVESKENDGLYQVTAKVEVRIEDFKAYIKKLAEGSVSVDEGLFAELATEDNNSSSKKGLLIETIVMPLAKSEVLKFAVGKPVSMSNARTSGNAAIRDAASKIPETGLMPESSFIVPIVVSVDPAFWDNMRRKLDSIADKKVMDQTTADYPCFKLFENLEESQLLSRAYIAVERSGSVIDCYGIDNVRDPRGNLTESNDQLMIAIERGLGFDAYGGLLEMRSVLPDLLVTFLGGDGSPVSEHLISRNNVDGREYPRDDVSNPTVLSFGGWSGLSSLGGTQSILYVGQSYPLMIVVSLPMETLKKVKKINIKAVSH